MTTAPLTPADCNLQDFHRMMLDIPRLRGSEFDATIDDGAWRAGLNLWMSAWHHVPAASLPDDEGALAKAAGLGRDVRTWKKVRALALRGWVKCSDGLLYHPVIAELAIEAWIDKLVQAISSGAGNAKRYGHVFDAAPIEADIDRSLAMLAALNPKSKALAKAARRKSRAPSQTPPIGSDGGSHRETNGVPPGSQENRNGTEEEVGGVKARAPAACDDWPEGDAADALVRAVNSPWLDPSKSLGLVTTAGFLEAWRRAGAQWFRDVVPVVTGMCAARRELIGTWKYFDQAIRRAVAENSRTLEIPDAAKVVSFRPGQTHEPAPASARDAAYHRDLADIAAAMGSALEQ